MEFDPLPSRRGLLTAFLWAALGSIAVTLTAAAARFLRGPADEAEGGRLLEAGPIEKFRDAADPVEAIVEMAERDGYFPSIRRRRLFIVSDGGRLSALSSTCTHLGCTVSWDGARRLFRCPCHGGLYRRDGSVAGGPPPRGLARLPLQIRDGKVLVQVEERA